MNDLIMMFFTAFGALAVALAISASVLIAGIAITGTLSTAGGAIVAALPAVACIGGVAWAASQTGYGKR